MRIILLLLLVSLSASAHSLVDNRVRTASEVITNRMTSSHPIPSWVSDSAKCIASIKVVKVGIIWGGQASSGLVTCKTADGVWSAPSFFLINGINFGLQLGVQFLESALLFITDTAREILNRGSFQIGADISFAAGPVGGGAGASEMPNAHILSYQRAVGLYAGATINGFILAHNRVFNNQVYESTYLPPEQILKTNADQAPMAVQPFVRTVNRYFLPHSER